ncbi:MAG: acetylserotonin O-methyltransferase, partial [Deltaproteobacteria bacterium]|nr:acetylserotonin O-methyltransferase [Deltaproteobacteria bacterium]
SNGPAENEALLQKAADAAREGGRVVIQEFMADPDRTSPPFAAMFALNMLVATAAGDTYTESEITAWMQKAGLSNVQRQDTPFNTSLLMGEKG